ncbi:hypothetical protein Z517_02160 [Fonsecaea pedrosoi CBS 271.37]|uniref:Extracellular membrane protein CFEM domain-containing protein n=1 Tax=Fonsecaea pedrosoi CBS 271.37 TaxID=1442368 RepID=A0A0D2F8K9_9EURO|nr:uncharacterized protein Z517_02160 [Fonsecaea pedrosoi CBS 271.37]KIW82917.1 hypothetical protein Z517_02160 [Fonsecaea pedrosoi CBS 271.37]
MTLLAGLLARAALVGSATAPLQQAVAGTPYVYTNWTQLPTCAQTCYSAALLQAFGSCGSILSGGGNVDLSSSYASASASATVAATATTTATTNDNNVGVIDDDSPSAVLRRCICTDCSYRTALAACLSGSCTTAEASVDDILCLNDRVFCNATVDATVQMWDRNLIWVVVVGAQGDESSLSPGTPREMAWTCATGTSSVTETATAVTSSSSSTSSSSASSMSQTTVPAIRTTTITATLTLDPSYPSQATNPSSVITLTVPLGTGSDIVSALTSTSTTLSSSTPTTAPTSLPSMTTHSSSPSESSIVTLASVAASSWATPPSRSFRAGILLVSAVIVGLVY